MSILHRIYNRLFRKPSKSQIEQLQERGLKLGANNIIHSPDCFDSLYPWLIEVGDNCMFSTEVKVLAHDSSTCFVTDYAKVGRVRIGSNVYLGFRTTVLCNVTIGDNVIVGANSLVNKDLASGGVYAGNPARYICSIEEYRGKQEALLEHAPKYEESWRYWANDASMEERFRMKDELSNTCGYIR